ncbi:Glucoamylase (glucan-1,4-alpha-glucosidase), GH15 family [Abditibacterium utsteinense]|uniref:Glucoamylase (Glucan-1,4-alpha-glucosidase), GH15 family n=1 Tax=Abditibacterium utsteinense TaxID=1960156 RepID=A0A2S8SS71_9BACT|nr:glycoside hydrolase family 15 protein [Abditibacterium utsteinense]PQV63637.1 Glucoamylase (glucan-1,4-alpha-glucosidase), GH15 family [Abditibacterium utsteinense]
MPVFLPTATLGNTQNLLSLGGAGEIMAWFYPHKDAPQHVHECLPCVYLGHAGQGDLHWSFGPHFERSQAYLPASNALQTTLQGLGFKITYTDLVPDEFPALVRQIEVENISNAPRNGGFYLYGDWNLGGIRAGNSATMQRDDHILLQNHRDAALAIGGDAMQGWHVGKAGRNWGNNARTALENGVLTCQDLEIGDVNWACGFYAELAPGEKISKTLILALGESSKDAISHLKNARAIPFESHLQNRLDSDKKWLQSGRETLENSGATLPEDLKNAYERSLLCLPLLCGQEGVAVAAPEFDPEFEACGGYGYLWPRDGGEYVSGLQDAGYPQFSEKFFDWCAKYQDESGLWHQRYFLNGEPGPNWCLPPETLQIDQVGAVLWAFGKWFGAQIPAETSPVETALHTLRGLVLPDATAKIEQASLAKLRGQNVKPTHREMIRRAADYLISRQDETTGVHKNAFDTWETFVGSFTYSNAAIHAAFVTAFQILGEQKYADAAQKMKRGVLQHFVRDNGTYKYLTRGFKSDGSPDLVVDSASLGAIEPFELLDLDVPEELELAVGTLRAVTEKLEVDWMGARAIRRFEGDEYVGGVPACVNTLWMARCCLHIATKNEDKELIERAQGYLQVVLKRATPTGLLPELMQGPTGQQYWAAPHGWAMASFVSGVLKLAALK